MPRFAIDNAIVVLLSMIIMALMYWGDLGTQRKKAKRSPEPSRPGEAIPAREAQAAAAADQTHLDFRSLRNAYWYFFGALGCLLLSYCATGFGAWPKQIQELLHPVTHVISATLSNIANACAVIAAIAYARGRDFDPADAKWWLGFCVLLFLLWGIGWEVAQHRTSLFFSTVFTAPDIVGASLALILLGWVFFARWSGLTLAYLFTTILYAILQLPARMYLDIRDFFGENKLPLALRQEVNLVQVFNLLLIGKILLIGGFIMLIRKVTKDIDEPRVWPTEDRASPYPPYDLIVALVFAIAAAFAVEYARETVAAVVPSGAS